MLSFFNKSVAALGVVLTSSIAHAVVAFAPSSLGNDPNPNDPFEGATGGTVSGIPLYPNFSLADLFGASVSGIEPGHTIFSGSGTSTFTFTTASPVTIAGYTLYASGGGSDGRELSSFELLADTGSGFTTLGSGSQTVTDANYTTADSAGVAGGYLTVSDAFAPVTASSFEVILNNAAINNQGARLIELDAVGTPEPTSAALVLAGGALILVRRKR